MRPFQNNLKIYLTDLYIKFLKNLLRSVKDLKGKKIILRLYVLPTHMHEASLDTLLSEPIFPKTDCVPSRFTCFTASDGALNYSIKPISKAPVFRVSILRIKTSF